MNWQYIDDTLSIVQRIDPLNGWMVSQLVTTEEIQQYIKDGGKIDDPPPKPIVITLTIDKKLAQMGITKKELQTYLGLAITVSV